VILPVVGLLLLLGLFWYWASTLIGDDSDNGSDVTPTVAIVIDSTETATATTTAAAGITPTESSNQPAGETPTESTGNNNGNQQEEETPTEEATESSDEAVSTAFAMDDTVRTNDSVNMRSDPDASGENVIVTLDAGTELTIIGGPEEGPDGQGGNLVWWQVRDTATGDEGWVAEDYLEAS
jgi:hypothetical protein